MNQIQKWGNSLGVCIPKALIIQLGFEEGTEIDLYIEKDKLVIKRKQKNLNELLSQITPENIHKVDTGKIREEEIW